MTDYKIPEMINLDQVIEAMSKTKLITIKKASELLGVTSLTLRRWDKSGRLKAIRVGSRGDRRYEDSKLLQLIKEGRI